MKIAYFVLWFPKLSQRFIQREISGLEENGIEVDVFPCHSFPRRQVGEPGPYRIRYGKAIDLVRFPVHLARVLWRDRQLLAEGLNILRRFPPTSLESWYMTTIGVFTAIRNAERIRHGCYDLLHSAWANGAGTAVAVLSRLTGIPYSFGGVARDIYRHGGDPFLAPKMRAARFVHTDTKANVDYLRGKGAGNGKIVLARRGLGALPDLSSRRRAIDRLRVLSVARLIEKKAHRLQIEACRILRQRGIPFELKIVGDGHLRNKLKRMVREYGLTEEVQFCGALPPTAVNERYCWADILLHTGIVDPHGDQDALPNVVPEAFAHEVAVIASRTPGVTEAVIDGHTGLTVDVRQPERLADAIERLAKDDELRIRLGAAGRRWVEEHFMLDKNAAILADAMRHAVGRR